jgi:DNA-binding beta-propeller fold protein YncE
MRNICIAALTIMAMSAVALADAVPTTQPYRVISTSKVGGTGGWDYVYADTANRRLYIPRGGRGSGRVDVYDLDTLAPVGTIPDTASVHGVAIDPKSGHGFSSSRPPVMFDIHTLKAIQTIDVKGRPDGILFDPATEHVFIFSHRAPNATVINAADGTVVGTIDDLGGEPEQAVSDGAGHIYVDIENSDNIAVVDAKTLQVLTHYDISAQGGGPGGLALDAKNHVLFAFCHDPATAVILDATTGKIIASLPIGSGVDAAEFNPNTMEAFSSQGDGTLTVIKEDSPTSFEVEQTVATKRGARTSTLDTQTNQIYLITADQLPPATQSATQPATQSAGGEPPRREGRGAMVPGSFIILVVGR